ncbi:hypothetical protein [Sediminispirochaeta bajacaliforniensis]|uniref:hypothetical protein n=1 Tax=Sediminispirochaeta bajacaliforniensis TaxID=148 RepID=UPI000362CCB6|nr:hypothetical protein [Sediminispirochaeta bajacaliforniensis]
MNHFKRLTLMSLLVLIALLLSSCLGVEMDVSINNDGSGTVDMAFHISQMFFQMDPEQQDVPIPITKEQLESSYEGVEGVTVVDVAEEDTEDRKTITATLAFDDFSDLSKGEENMFEGATLTKENGRTVFRTVLKDAVEPGEEGDMTPSDPSQEEMIKQYFEGYSFLYRVRAPKKIKSHSIGELSDNNRVLTYEIPMYDFNSMQNSEPLVLEVSW